MSATPEEPGRADPRTRIERGLAAVVLALLALLAWQLVRRVPFPWDFLIWSESPFMTNMMKLSAGQPLFGPPADANSFLYSPGLEYLCYALLRPLSLQLDVRACRVVVVALGLLAAVATAASAARLLAALGARASWSCRVFTFGLTALLVFRSFTADVCHPDNLHLAHAAATFLLLYVALGRRSLRLALCALALSAVGVFAKQTAVAAPVGVLGALLLAGHGFWSLRQRLLLVAVGVAAPAGALAVLLSTAESRFFLVEVLSRQALQWWRVPELVQAVTWFPPRAVLVVGALGAVVSLSVTREGRLFLVCWLAAAFEVLPSLGAYLKVFGSWNNLTVVDVWLVTLVVPWAWHLMGQSLQRLGSPGQLGGPVLAGALGLLTLALVPLKRAPAAEAWALGEALDRRIAEDTRAGRRVLLPHGTTPLLRAGQTAPPRDRSNTLYELNAARLDAHAGTRSRLEARYYGRLYLFAGELYGKELLEVIERGYRQVEVLPPDSSPAPPDPFLAGDQGFMRRPVQVMEPR